MPAPSESPAPESTGLHVTDLGERGQRVVFCHGLFGQGKNWTTIAKALADNHRVSLVDMPNHGKSPWTERLDLAHFADLVAELIDPDDPVALVGHSMGGKVAMLLALRHPHLVERLAVVDISPVVYASGSEFYGYIAGMQALDLEAMKSRGDVDKALVGAVPHPTVRSFLMQNLRRNGDSWAWQPNLQLLGDELDVITGWPELGEVTPYDGRVVWIAGERSPYISDAYAPAMDRLFPRNRRVTVKEAGHWVHSEQPAIFIEIMKRFLAV